MSPIPPLSSQALRAFLPLIALASLLLGTGVSLASEHSFRLPNGEDLTGEVISIEGTTAQIKRTSDSQTVSIPIGPLSTADKTYLLGWMEGKTDNPPATKELPAGWAQLRVHLPLASDEIFSYATTDGLRRVGGNTFDGHLLIGSWVSVYINRTEKGFGDLNAAVLKYNGEAEWFLTLQGHKLYRSFEAGTMGELVAVDIPEDTDAVDLAIRFAEIKAEAKSTAVFFRIHNARALEALAKSGIAVSGLAIDRSWHYDTGLFRPRYINDGGKERDATTYSLLPEFLPTIAPGALSLQADSQLLELLSTIPSLEHLTLTEDKEKRWSFGAFQSLQKLPGLRSLWIDSNEYPEADFMVGFDKLQTLKINGSGQVRSPGHVRDPLLLPPLPSLAALSVNSPISFNSESLKNLPALKYLQGRKLSDKATPPQELIAAYWDDREGKYDVALEKGHYRNLRILRTAQNVEFAKMPGLVRLDITAPKTPLKLLEGCHSVRSLKINYIGQKNLEKFVSMPEWQNLESLSISNSRITDFAPLARLPKLRLLLVSASGQRDAPELIDLGKLPDLENFTLFSSAKIKSIAGIAAHPKLRHLRLSSCPSLSDLGAPDTNTTLESISLSQLGALTDLSSFSKMTGIRSFTLGDCQALKPPFTLDKTNPIEYLRILNSGELKSYPPPQKPDTP